MRQVHSDGFQQSSASVNPAFFFFLLFEIHLEFRKPFDYQVLQSLTWGEQLILGGCQHFITQRTTGSRILSEKLGKETGDRNVEKY